MLSSIYCQVVRVYIGRICIAESSRTTQVGETIYFPTQDVDLSYLIPHEEASTCIWKGDYYTYDFHDGSKTIRDVAWLYFKAKDQNAAFAHKISFSHHALVRHEGMLFMRSKLGKVDRSLAPIDPTR